MKDITVQELAEALENNPNFTLLDVRENYEFNYGHLNCPCVHIPMDELVNRIGELDINAPTYVICKTGGRAAAVSNFLKSNYGFPQIAIVIGGVEAYANEIDQSIKV